MRGPAKILIPLVAAFLLSLAVPGKWSYLSTWGEQKMDKAGPTTEGPSSDRGAAFGHTPSSLEQLAEMLEDKRLELNRRAELLSQREEQVRAVQEQIENRIAELRDLRKEIEKAVKRQDAREEQKLNKLAKVYEATEPEEAGRLLSRLNVKLAAQILLKMSDAKAGRLWAHVQPEQAVKISEELYSGGAEGE